ncbi:hypothetical protein [Streptomyces sp. Li-HN-5-11]|uniref:hypothetical protein n=1 Tax=Streptomyces sp. Li-HN-5-11 TaxID=3075432 RepID=UPI0037D9BC22
MATSSRSGSVLPRDRVPQTDRPGFEDIQVHPEAHLYDWALADVADDQPGHRHLLVRRNRNSGELAFHRCYSATPVPMATLVRVAGRRWTVEETFQAAKGLTGLDEHQVVFASAVERICRSGSNHVRRQPRWPAISRSCALVR